MLAGALLKKLCLRGVSGRKNSTKTKLLCDGVIKMLGRVTGIDEVSVGQLYSDLILCKANQILSSAIPPSLKFLVSSQPRDRIETTSYWKSFVLFSKQGGGGTVY